MHVTPQTGSDRNVPLEVQNIGIPRIGPREVLIKVSACGVCHSNLHMVEGDWLDMGVPAKSPIAPDHELMGTVEEVGNEVTSITLGDKVGIQRLYDTCGTYEPYLTSSSHGCS